MPEGGSELEPLAMSPIGNLDDLLERARRGVLAGTALDAIKDTLQQLRDNKYRELLNAPDTRVLELRYELRAIEKLALSLLKQESLGRVAHEQLLLMRGDQAPEETPLRATRVSRPRKARGQAGAKTPTPSAS